MNKDLDSTKEVKEVKQTKDEGVGGSLKSQSSLAKQPSIKAEEQLKPSIVLPKEQPNPT